eukprot:maker-scaffold344_size201325-snap-gene-1.22 protein:Tk02542 transcript:maker-scaffold344_size201325-snap-gene-1.22-mRNA-1 annotation:"RAB-33 "
MSETGPEVTPEVHQSGTSRSGSKRQRRTFKVIVIGDSGVGKTCLTYRFCAGHFPTTGTEATIGVDFREKIVQLTDGEEVRVQFWDTAGQERFRRSMVSHYYRNVQAVVLVYDVSARRSFDAMPQWLSECDLHGLTGQVPMVMVGNKCEDGLDQAVPIQEAQRLADDHHMPVFETSAKDDSQSDHVDAIFLTLANKIKQAKPLLDSLNPSGRSNESQSPKRVLYRNDSYQGANGGCCF